MNRDEARGYLAGIFDGEGSCKYERGVTRTLTISNTDLAIIEATGAALALLGIEYTVRPMKLYSPLARKPIWQLYISGQLNLRHFAADVPIQSIKRQKLAAALATYKRGPQRRSLHLLRKEDSA